jgi:hypothetical protein
MHQIDPIFSLEIAYVSISKIDPVFILQAWDLPSVVYKENCSSFIQDLMFLYTWVDLL